ncbi:hypothetical protein CHGG_03224 [Chaetomium globosum CBS 148.51]|uniref:Large ribosomal subunit protein uL10-like insertion domain-containing protein n=1 Tax=Chaetomium globosum (strain ATCC 6205 / CBS 148.51 / DSM 1962 / NBRC 6347 / NRRL 1970) TaxID=306901 RepID=Q2H980_CHAGB|nr:mRNA turnover protein MRT4 [Chaetomium globosum CBS 148.51]EAQ91289.1 hypothetical protein CHGG_03224 [Chaetomium globosum CBS 148.51]
MPKSKRSKVFHLTQVTKKTREQKDKLFSNIRDIFFGKTKLTARALGTTPEDAQADGIDQLTRYLAGSVGLLFTNRAPAAIQSYFASLTHVDFARAGTVASRTVTVPPGLVYSTGGEVPAEHDVPVAHTLEPELRRLGMPTRMVKGKVCLGGDESGEGSAEGYTICREGEVLDSRQTRLLKLFSVCMSEFRVGLLAYWSAASGEVTELEGAKERLAMLQQQQEKGGGKGKAKEGDDGEMEEDEEDEE